MINSDDLFCREFVAMMRGLKGIHGNMSVLDVPIPDELKNKCFVLNAHQVYIDGIETEYYSNLNRGIHIMLSKPSLLRRKFDHTGQFIKNQDGSYKTEEVPVHHGMVAIASDRAIGVKTKFKSKEGFTYVDYIEDTSHGTRERKFLYIVPKKYCYRVNQVALVVSTNKLQRKFYSGVNIALTNGSILYIYVIPYSPTMARQAFRVLATGTSPEELFGLAGELYKYWVQSGFAFNPAACECFGSSSPRNNMAYEEFPGQLDTYSLYKEVNLVGEKDTNMDMFNYTNDLEESEE